MLQIVICKAERNAIEERQVVKNSENDFVQKDLKILGTKVYSDANLCRYSDSKMTKMQCELLILVEYQTNPITSMDYQNR